MHDKCMLNDPISIMIKLLLEAVVVSLPKGKAPEVDGIPNEEYSQYGKIPLPFLLKTFNAPLREGCLSLSIAEAIIVVIPKKGKDMLFPDSYRPIVLLNTDITS